MNQKSYFIVCMKWGKKFGADYVNRLYKMVKKNTTLPFIFICFTDDKTGIDKEIETRKDTLGVPRQLKGADGIELYEINLTAEIQIAELVSVMESLSKSPTFVWRNLYLRPNNVINPDYININAVIGAVCFKNNENQVQVKQ